MRLQYGESWYPISGPKESPAYLVLHEENAFSFYGLCDDGGRHACYGARLIKCSFQLIEIVAVRYVDYVEGKGVSFMENQVGWHGKAPNDEEYAIAMAELEKAGEALCQK